MSDKLEMSYTKANTWRLCHKKYWWIYVERLAPKVPKKTPLILGDCVHRMLHKLYTKQLTQESLANLHEYMVQEFPDQDPDQLWDMSVDVGTLILGYVKKWEKDDLTVVSSEIHLRHEFDDFILYGRVDALARDLQQKLWRMEHKTAKRMDSYYLGGLRTGFQGGLYHFLLEQNLGEKLEGTVYNMLVKTKIPDYPRMRVQVKPRHVERSLETLHGIVREINKGDFYPSSDCFTWNEECPFMKLCDSDSQQTRDAFYTRREERKEVEQPTKEKGETE